ncbi:hypothetical protein NBRC116494_18920 [Aurantivibrio plasticivorans]
MSDKIIASNYVTVSNFRWLDNDAMTGFLGIVKTIKIKKTGDKMMTCSQVLDKWRIEIHYARVGCVRHLMLLGG